jgi:hypothetical protein
MSNNVRLVLIKSWCNQNDNMAEKEDETTSSSLASSTNIRSASSPRRCPPGASWRKRGTPRRCLPRNCPPCTPCTVGGQKEEETGCSSFFDAGRHDGGRSLPRRLHTPTSCMHGVKVVEVNMPEQEKEGCSLLFCENTVGWPGCPVKQDSAISFTLRLENRRTRHGAIKVPVLLPPQSRATARMRMR